MVLYSKWSIISDGHNYKDEQKVEFIHGLYNKKTLESSIKANLNLKKFKIILPLSNI